MAALFQILVTDIDPTTLDGRPFALLLMGEDEQGAEDWAVFGGIARWDGRELRVERSEQGPFVVSAAWLARVRPTTEETREILLGAEFYLPLSVGPLPPDADPADYLATGMRWPEERRDDGAAI